MGDLMPETEYLALKQEYQAALLANLDTDSPIWTTNPKFQFPEEPLGKLSLTTPVWGAPCLIIHGPLNPLEGKLLEGMKKVLPEEIGDVPELILTRQVQHARLVQHLQFWQPRALWLLGEACAQFVLKTHESLGQLQAKHPLALSIQPGEKIAVIITDHPRDLLDNLPGKRRSYQDLLKLNWIIQKMANPA